MKVGKEIKRVMIHPVTAPAPEPKPVPPIKMRKPVWNN